MPSADVVLAGLADLANRWTSVALLWHGYVLALVVAIWRSTLSTASLGWFIVAPIVSVSVLAWLGGNPFNATMFALLAITLAWSVRRLPDEPLARSSPVWAVSGFVLLGFGWTYPHFLEPSQAWHRYLYAAPLGVLPCPTLAAAIGLTLLTEELRAGRWSAALLMAGTAYAIIGIFRLGVALDYGLLGGVLVLAISYVRQRRSLARRAAWLRVGRPVH